MKKLIFLSLITLSTFATADCEFNGKTYKPMESTTLFEPAHYKLSKEQQSLYADGAALIIVCTPVIDVKKLEGNNWARHTLNVTKDVWVGAQNNWLYRDVTFQYPNKSVAIKKQQPWH